MFFSHRIGAIFGAYLGGLALDLAGKYSLAWIAMVVVDIIAALIQLLMGDRPFHATPAQP